MVSQKLVVLLLIVAVLLSVVSIVMTLSLSVNAQNSVPQGNNYGKVGVVVVPNPEVEPNSSGGAQ